MPDVNEVIRWHESEAVRAADSEAIWRTGRERSCVIQAERFAEVVAFHRGAAQALREMQEERERLLSALEDIATRRNIDRIDCAALARRALSPNQAEP